jgi:hypothetical protein
MQKELKKTQENRDKNALSRAPIATSMVIATATTSPRRPLPRLAGRNSSVLTGEGTGRDPAILAWELPDPDQPV